MAKVKPFANEFRPKLIKHLVEQISKGETAALVGLPGIGKTNTIHWLKKRIGSKKNILLIHLDLKSLASSNDLSLYRLLLLEIRKLSLKNILKEINDIYEKNINIDDELLLLDAIKKILSRILVTTEKKICILIDGYEELANMTPAILNSLTTIRTLNKTRISYLFIGNTDPEKVFPSNKSSDLFILLNYNTHWIRLLNKEESEKLIEEFSDLLGASLTKEAKNKILLLSGGHAWYIKVLTKLFYENHIEDNISMQEIGKINSIKIRAENIWQTLKKDYQFFIRKALLSKNLNELDIPEYFIKSDFLKIDGNEIKFFSPLFGIFIRDRIRKPNKLKKSFTKSNKEDHKKGILLDHRKLVIYKNGKAINKQFTKNELKLIKYFIENESLVTTRDDIAEVIWGKESNSKYSDWAIDKIISRIRKKIEDNPRKPTYIKTLRGLGFKFTQSD